KKKKKKNNERYIHKPITRHRVNKHKKEINDCCKHKRLMVNCFVIYSAIGKDLKNVSGWSDAAEAVR
ncbi:hypothetical protein, partial [Escherichia coli]|uniref:hypothetical protein n=1 Tax=Escherichia coli TaxID=562 RepID=UPI001BB0D083